MFFVFNKNKNAVSGVYITILLEVLDLILLMYHFLFININCSTEQGDWLLFFFFLSNRHCSLKINQQMRVFVSVAMGLLVLV